MSLKWLNTRISPWVGVCVVAVILGVVSLNFWMTRQTNLKIATSRTLYRLDHAISMYAADTGRLPGATVPEAITNMGRCAGFWERVGGSPTLRKSQDCWGRELKISVSGGKYIIWSCGRNGVDEGGRGDDIAVAGDVTIVLDESIGTVETRPVP